MVICTFVTPHTIQVLVLGILHHFITLTRFILQRMIEHLKNRVSEITILQVFTEIFVCTLLRKIPHLIRFSSVNFKRMVVEAVIISMGGGYIRTFLCLEAISVKSSFGQFFL